MYRVLVASMASRKALAIVKSLKKTLKSYVVGVSHKSWHPNNFSLYLDKLYITTNVNRAGKEWVLNVVHVVKELNVDVVIPVDFIDVLTFSKYKDLIEKYATLATPEYEDVVKASDKSILKKLFEGIAAVPGAVLIESRGDLNEVRGLKPPLVVKGLSDNSRPQYFIDYVGAEEAALARIPCLVQEYVAGRGRGYYAVSYGGVALLEFTHERIIEQSPSGGPSLSARGPILDPKLYAIGREFISRYNWYGPLMIETKYNYETGEYYVIEVNPKFWGSLDLPVSLGYHFPAVLATAYLEGVKKAKELATKFKVRSGEYHWVIDGLRLFKTARSGWNYLAKASLKNLMSSELGTLDLSKTFTQLAIALKKLRSSASAEEPLKLKPWVSNVITKAGNSSRKPLVIFDLDGVLIRIDNKLWRELRPLLLKEGFRKPWESISAMLYRLWLNDLNTYEEASKLIERYELKSKFKTLIDEELSNIKDKAMLCIASKQSVNFINEVLNMLGVKAYFTCVVGRDSGCGPSKQSMYLKILKDLNCSSNDIVFVVDDNLVNVVEALRVGLNPIRVAENDYRVLESMKLGIPSANAKLAIKILELTLNELSSLS